MSTLNTFGFNVRRKRNHTARSPLPSKQEKASTAPILAFAAPAPPSSQPIPKPQINSQLNKTNTKSKLKKPLLPKDPKQSTLLPFFATASSSSSSSPATPLPTNANPIVTQLRLSPVPMEASSHTTVQEQQTNSEDNEICLVKRHMTMNELLPILMDAFGEYSMDKMQSSKQQQQQQQPLILLQVKPNKTMRTLQTETMDFTIENGIDDHLMPTRQRRRRSCHEMNEDECHQTDDETETLRTAFTKSLSLVPVKKRLCGKSSTSSSSSHRTISALFENGQERHLYALEDEFGKDTQTHEEDNEIYTVRRCISPGEVNSLLLDIANEYLAFENNAWCASYVGL